MKQKYDNQGGVNRAKAKVTELVKKGHRLGKGASDFYHNQVIAHSKSPRERNKAVVTLMDPARKAKKKR